VRVRFGDFTLDTDTRQLRHGDVERHLSPKGFDLLRLLIEHRPRALSKSELHERLWPKTFVSDATLSSLVAEVREALGETARGGHFVRTAHRFGYAFDGDAVVTGARATADAAEQVRCWVIWEHGHLPLRDGEYLVGRDGDVSVWLESPTISRHHARIRISGTDATIEDLGSKNGTFVRGARLEGRARLTDGDQIRLGSVALTIRVLTDETTITEYSP